MSVSLQSIVETLEWSRLEMIHATDPSRKRRLGAELGNVTVVLLRKLIDDGLIEDTLDQVHQRFLEAHPQYAEDVGD
jgi:hypothetical protein